MYKRQLLGTGVGAAVGAAGEAARESDENAAAGTTGYYDTYDTQDTYYNDLNSAYQSGGRAIAVDDNIPEGPLMEAVARHGGRQVQG